MAKETPLQTMKRLYGSKDKLIDTAVSAAKSAGEDVSDMKERLVTVSNKKLLHLAEVSKTVSEKYGNRDKLIESIGAAVGKAKDSDYLKKLSSFSSARLLDVMRAAERAKKKAA